MPKPGCIECRIEMRVEEIGVIVLELYENNITVYKVWNADLLKCPICMREITYGYGDNPVEVLSPEEETIRSVMRRYKQKEGRNKTIIQLRGSI